MAFGLDWRREICGQVAPPGRPRHRDWLAAVGCSGCSVTSLGAIAAMGSALAVSGLSRRLGLAVGGIAALSVALLPLLRDWPPFVSAIMTTVIGVGIVASAEDS